MSDQFQDLQLVTQPSRDALNDKQIEDYCSHREKMMRWLLSFGKDPDHAEGYAFGTVKRRAYRIDKFYRWVWSQEGGYTTNVTSDHADTWIQEIAYADKSNTHKSNCVKALRALFKWALLSTISPLYSDSSPYITGSIKLERMRTFQALSENGPKSSLWSARESSAAWIVPSAPRSYSPVILPDTST